MARLFPRLAFPDTRLALDVDDVTIDYSGLARRAAGHASRLRALGIGRGDTVGLMAHGALDTLVAVVGNANAGVVTVPISPKLGATELAHVLADSAPSVVFTTAAQATDDRARCMPVVVEAITLEAEVPAEDDARGIDDDDLLLLYTSGTTGAPKGVPMTARAVASNLDGLADAWGMTDRDEVVHALPLFHVHGLVLGVLGPLRFGGGVRHRSRFEPADLTCALTRGTVLFAVPTMVHRLAEAAEQQTNVREALRGARLLVSGSAALSPRDHARVLATTGRHFIERYGATEVLIACAARAGEPPRSGTVGRAVPGVTVRLVDDSRRPLEQGGGMGEVAVAGPAVFRGYRNRPDATAEVLADGWYYSGDLATQEEDGSLRIVGRRSTDLIKTGGFRVGAGEIETCLAGHPSVSEVAVVGRPDDDLGERIVAFVVPHEGAPRDAEALIAHVATKLSPAKRPREVCFIEALPRNALGKLQKKRLP